MYSRIIGVVLFVRFHRKWNERRSLQDHLTEHTSAVSFGLVLNVQCLGVRRVGVTA